MNLSGHEFFHGLGLAFVAVSIGWSEPVAAQDDPVSVPDLRGEWSASAGHVVHTSGSVSDLARDVEVFYITVDTQTDATFSATQRARAKSGIRTGTNDGRPLEGEGPQLIGVIDWDGETVRIVDVGDDTNYLCRAAVNEMRCTYWETGAEAIAGRVIFQRSR